MAIVYIIGGGIEGWKGLASPLFFFQRGRPNLRVHFYNIASA